MGAVILGRSGLFELTRDALGERITSEIRGSDVNTVADRFSFDFPPSALMTGDMLEIKSLDNTLLDFIAPSGWGDNIRHRQGKWYVYIDEAGGIKLYRDFDAAVAGERTGRVELAALSRTIPIEFTVSNVISRNVASVTNYTFSTTRETQDVSELSEEFRQQYGTIITGSGSLDCHFKYRYDPLCGAPSSEKPELSMYLHQLVMRLRLGSDFKARLFLVAYGSQRYSAAVTNDQVWYEIQGLITNVSIAVEPEAILTSTIDFVTTGEIKLRSRTVSNYLVQEDGQSRLALEAYQDGFIELEQGQQTD